jgi:predicted GIY-YIG superfamily endonuclease
MEDLKSREDVQCLARSLKGEWIVYVISSVLAPMRTYCGVTNDWPHRIRQHNGEISGGAKATKTTRPWVISALLYGFGSDKSLAMRAEWFSKIKHYKSSGRVPGSNGPQRRACVLKYAMDKCRGRGSDIKCACCDHNMIREKERSTSTELNVIITDDSSSRRVFACDGSTHVGTGSHGTAAEEEDYERRSGGEAKEKKSDEGRMGDAAP